MTIEQLQRQLNILGFGPLVEDGKSGPKTIDAIKRFQKSKALLDDGKVGPNTLAALIGFPRKKGTLLTTRQLTSKYGTPCNVENLTVINLPYPMRLAWDKTKYINRFEVHKAVAEKLTNVFKEILIHYGLQKIKDLGIDLYGGCYNCRQMRGSTTKSVHSWGLAVDIDPERNALYTPFINSGFFKAEYAPMFQIFYNHGFINLGLEANRDTMHFQIGS